MYHIYSIYTRTFTVCTLCHLVPSTYYLESFKTSIDLSSVTKVTYCYHLLSDFNQNFCDASLGAGKHKLRTF